MPSGQRYEPSEARFLGAPIDYIIFENIDSCLVR
ncbi:MAG: hypothetical protein OXP12_01770 [Thaumarchaeota archaeon]|nr:hypothetical protein [Nitrososphaerota archaeon]